MRRRHSELGRMRRGWVGGVLGQERKEGTEELCSPRSRASMIGMIEPLCLHPYIEGLFLRQQRTDTENSSCLLTRRGEGTKVPYPKEAHAIVC